MPGGTSPYHSALDTPLLQFGADVWRIGDAVEGTAIWGAPGSGKSSGSGRNIAQAFLRAGMGGIVLCAKTDECATWQKYAAATGRSDDILIVDSSADQRFNILDWAAQNIATAGFESNLVELMTRMAEAANVANAGKGGGGDNDNKYFVTNVNKWFANAFPMLLLAHGTLRMRDLYNFITSAPQSLSDVYTKEQMVAIRPADYEHPDFPFYLKTLMLAAERVGNLEARYLRAKADGKPADEQKALDAEFHHAMKLVDEHADFFITEYPKLDARPRTSIESTLTGLIYPFLSGKLADLFCTDTTFSPSDCRDGKIIIMDLPTLRYQGGGVTAQTMFKYLFGVAMQIKPVSKDDRPVFIFADEAQFFLNSADADMLSTARSSKTAIVYLTQDLPTYYAKLGDGSRDVAESILSKFGTRIFHANTSRETNNYASELVGKVTKYHVGENNSSSVSAGGGGGTHDDGAGASHGNTSSNKSKGRSLNPYIDYELRPDYFSSELRMGGPGNGLKVDGVVIRNGRNWKWTKRHWVKAEFSQR